MSTETIIPWLIDEGNSPVGTGWRVLSCPRTSGNHLAVSHFIMPFVQWIGATIGRLIFWYTNILLYVQIHRNNDWFCLYVHLDVPIHIHRIYVVSLYRCAHAMASRSAVKSAGSWWDHNRYGPEFKPTGQAWRGIPIPDILWLGNTKGSKDGWRIYIYIHLLYFVNPDAKNYIYYRWFCLPLSSKILLLTPQNFGRDLSSWILQGHDGLVDQCCLCSLTKQNAFAKVTTRQSLENKSLASHVSSHKTSYWLSCV